ncbi:MAG: hypothetical protein AUH25_02210 [Thaumarchaeota archaeon 13_1_40CM_38_12]|nr:MAG: hypothetical protein AUH25_02210 [Thaumarchaeota archaeon 13_1_40CM_38_12]
MNNSDATEMEKDIGGQMILVVGRMPKKNNDAALQIYKQADDLLGSTGFCAGSFSNSTQRPTMIWALHS